MKKYNLIQFAKGILCFLLAGLLFSCSKQKISPGTTYPDGPEPLVKFLDGAPNPALGSEGSIVTFNVSGLKGKEGQFTFFINQVAAQVMSITDNTVSVKVPANASTGGSSVLISGEYYFGPTFIVKGKISIDPLFNTDAYRSDNAIQGIFERNDGTSYLIYGSFTNYKNQATTASHISGLAVLTLEGDFMDFPSQLVTAGRLGFNGSVSNVIQRPDDSYIVAGSFSKYDTTSNINNVTRLNSDGTLETIVADVVNPDPVNNPNDGQMIAPAFNGGTSGGNIAKIFYNSTTGNTNAVGNFLFHQSTFYERSTKSGPYIDLVKAKQLIRMKDNGAFDSTYNYNFATNQSYDGGNGFIYDAIQLSDGKLIVVGNFTSFDGIPSNYIARIDANTGIVDPTFTAGTGADGSINRILYNTTTGKILLTGNFKNFNGHQANGIVMINEDGLVDPFFTFRAVEGGIPNFAGQLNNGKIIVTGSFNKYDGIIRPGMLILNADGSLAVGYNNMGLFRGTVNNFVETTSTNGDPAIIMVGYFDRFDNTQVGNIIKFRIKN